MYFHVYLVSAQGEMTKTLHGLELQLRYHLQQKRKGRKGLGRAMGRLPGKAA